MAKFRVVGQVGGPGTYWDGYTYDLGSFPFFWMARLRARIHVLRWPYRVAHIVNATGPCPRAVVQ